MTESGSKFLQYLAASTANFNMIACGAILGWTSPMLLRLSESPVAPDNILNRSITKEEGSWLGSLVSVGVVFGSCISGYLGERFGRKRALLISTFPFIVGWVLVGTARDIIQMYVGRFILGVGIAIPFTVLPMYTGEISEASIRGALGTFLQIFISIGFLFSYIVGAFASFALFWLLCLGLHLCFFVSFVLMPESPYYLLSKGRELEAAEALARFRGKSVTSIYKEIEEIQLEIEEAYKTKTTWLDLVKVRVNRKALIFTCMLMIFQEFMGIDVVLFYVEDIFLDAGTNNSSMSAVIIGFVQLLGSVLTPFFVDRHGRKILLCVSSVGCGITIGILGVYFYLKDIKYPLGNATWLPMTSLIVYMIAFSIGWGPMPWTVMGEMFAPAAKSKGSSVCVFVLWSFSFLLTKFFTNVEQSLGAYVGFGFFGLCCAANIFFIVAFLPETKCKSLIEIQQKLGRRKKSIESPRVFTIENTIKDLRATKNV